MENPVAILDRGLTEAVDAAFDRARHLSGKWLACRRGCTECCIGPFPITALDAWRLRVGFDALASQDPARAEAVLRRAREVVRHMRADFPGDPDSGALSEDEAAAEAFAEKYHALPCPALDPERGTCDLYAARPISCRSYGPAVCIDGDDLPPCHLCFVGALRRDVEAARVRIHIAGRERAALLALGAAHVPSGDTIVAFVLTKDDRMPRLDF